MKITKMLYALGIVALTAQAQVPPNIEAELKEDRQIVISPLYRQALPASDARQ